jgi:hypothetical protein
MHGKYTRISKGQIKRCNKCDAEICFVQNRNDKWFPVNVVYPGEGMHRYPAYKHSAGAYNNMIPWHVCQPKHDYFAEQLVRESRTLSFRLAKRALEEFRKNPNTDQTKLTRVWQHVEQRTQRRFSALPEVSKRYFQPL